MKTVLSLVGVTLSRDVGGENVWSGISTLGLVLTHLPLIDLVLFLLIVDQGLNFLISSLGLIPVVDTFQLEAKNPVYTGL